MEGIQNLEVLEIRLARSTDDMSIHQRNRWHQCTSIQGISRRFLYFFKWYLSVSWVEKLIFSWNWLLPEFRISLVPCICNGSKKRVTTELTDIDTRSLTTFSIDWMTASASTKLKMLWLMRRVACIQEHWTFQIALVGWAWLIETFSSYKKK